MWICWQHNGGLVEGEGGGVSGSSSPLLSHNHGWHGLVAVDGTRRRYTSMSHYRKSGGTTGSSITTTALRERSSTSLSLGVMTPTWSHAERMIRATSSHLVLSRLLRSVKQTSAARRV